MSRAAGPAELVAAARAAGISDELVLAAMTGTPRAGFVPARYVTAAYRDEPIPIGRWPDLAGQARRNLARQGIGNIRVLAGDGSCGLPDRAPYDAILVSAAFPAVPAPLAAQLRVGGRLVQPIGPGGKEQVVLFERSASGLERRQVLTLARFVRLHGRHGFQSRP